MKTAKIRIIFEWDVPDDIEDDYIRAKIEEWEFRDAFKKEFDEEDNIKNDIYEVIDIRHWDDRSL